MIELIIFWNVITYPIFESISNKIMRKLSVDGVLQKSRLIYPGEIVIFTISPKYRINPVEDFKAHLFDHLQEFNAILYKIADFGFYKIGKPPNAPVQSLDYFVNADPIYASKYGQSSLYKAINGRSF